VGKMQDARCTVFPLWHSHQDRPAGDIVTWREPCISTRHPLDAVTASAGVSSLEMEDIVSNVSGVEAQTGRSPARYGPTSP
jgi:hypothetical protein